MSVTLFPSEFVYVICFSTALSTSSLPIATEELPSAIVLAPIAMDWSPKARAPSLALAPPPIAVDCLTNCRTPLSTPAVAWVPMITFRSPSSRVASPT